MRNFLVAISSLVRKWRATLTDEREMKNFNHSNLFHFAIRNYAIPDLNI